MSRHTVLARDRVRCLRLRRLAVLPLCAVLLLAGWGTALASGGESGRGAPSGQPWMNPALAPAQRARLLLAEMTLAEKVELMTGNQGAAPYAYYNAPIPRLHIPALKMADSTDGIGPRGWTLPGTGPNATQMPAPIALGASWSLPLVSLYAATVTDEVLETGQNVLLGPDADVARTPWWGRTVEANSEDPIFNADVNSLYSAVVQSKQVIATLKHYAAYNQETNRGSGLNVNVDLRTFREVYTLAFEAAIKRANIGAVMCSFNKINGGYSCENSTTLRGLLKEMLGFTGFVLTDFGAIHSTVPALRGGTDMETGTTTVFDGSLLAAAQSGQAPLWMINASCLRILTTMFRVGIFDHGDYKASSIPVAAHDAVALRTEEQAITLLKNSSGALPLSRRVKSIALIGADASILAAPDGAPYVSPTRQTTVLDGVTARAHTAGATVAWVRGNDPVNPASMIEDPGMTAVPSSVLSPTSGSGTGLQSYYWTNPTFQGAPAVSRLDPQVKYDTGFLSDFGVWGPQTTQVRLPPSGAQSVVYDGHIVAPRTGDYRLALTGWGDATLAIDGAEVVNATGLPGRFTVSSPALHWVRGESHTIHITYQADRPLNGLEPGTLLLEWTPPAGTLSPSTEQAVRAARASDVAIVYVRTYEGEQRDRVTLHLPESGDALVSAVAAANPHTIVVLASNGPVTMPWLKSVPAVVQTYFGGQEQGGALAHVLWGDVNPSGKLTVTYPTSETAVPPGINNPWATVGNLNVTYSEGLFVGYKGYDRAGLTPLFPFGYGLSYTTFRFSGVRVLPSGDPRDAAIHVRFKMTNTGSRAGAEVGEVYLGLPAATGEPPKRLVTFVKVELGPGQTREVDAVIEPTAPTHPLGYFDAVTGRWAIAPGTYRVFVGGSERDTPLTGTFSVS